MIERARELVSAGRSGEAVELLARAVKERPEDSGLHAALGEALGARGDWATAARAFATALQHDGLDVSAWLGLDRALARAPRPRMSDPMRAALAAALRAQLVDPAQLHHVIALAVASSPGMAEAYAGGAAPDLADPHLREVLRCARVIGVDAERVLREGRAELLALAAERPEAASTPVAEAIALQCHLNDHVYDTTDADRGLLAAVSARATELPPDAAWLSLVVLAAFDALSDAHRDALVALRPDDPLVRAYVLDRRDEAAFAPAIPRAGGISDAASLAVRGQYEAAPYPRWTTLPDLRGPRYAAVPLPRVPALVAHPAPRILVAGGGTGRHPITVAMLYPHADVVAADLSVASLAYATRQARRLGVANVRFVQADLLEAPAVLPGPFDAVEAVGVLHHLRDPLAGWRALIGVLAPGGVMRVGLYSTAARTSLAVARAAAVPGDRSDAALRRLRAEVIARRSEPAMHTVTRWPDFYARAECRDLLFPACEHTFSLPQIATAIADLGVELVGFDAPDARAAPLDLAAWTEAERAEPLLFAGMYQFWVRRPAC